MTCSIDRCLSMTWKDCVCLREDANIYKTELLHSCMSQPGLRLPSLHLALFVLSLQLLFQQQGYGATTEGFRQDGGLWWGRFCLRFCVCLCVCSRDLLELHPPEGGKTELQYASWGPQGNQLVSKAFHHLPEKTSRHQRTWLGTLFAYLQNRFLFGTKLNYKNTIPTMSL